MDRTPRRSADYNSLYTMPIPSKNKQYSIYKVLDAPGVSTNPSHSILDVSVKDILAVALSDSVYLWSKATSSVTHLMTSTEEITSLSFIRDGSHLAIGASNGDVQLWDICKKKRVRRMKGHTNNVSSLSWNRNVLTSGAGKEIRISDVSSQKHEIALIKNNNEITDIKWSRDGKYLASGDCEGGVSIWDRASYSDARYTLTGHTSPIGCLGWCPWQDNILCTLGSVFRFWNINNGDHVKCINRVGNEKVGGCFVLGAYSKEIIFANKKDIHILDYNEGRKVGEIDGHKDEITNIASNKDGSMIITSSIDESIRLSITDVIPRMSHTVGSGYIGELNKKANLEKRSRVELEKNGVDSPFSKLSNSLNNKNYTV